MKRLLLLAAMLLAPALCFAQNTTVTASVTDPVGAPYNNSTGYAALVCPQNAQPTLNGFTVPRTFPIVAFDSTGTFTQVVYDVSQLLPVGCGYQWHIIYQDGVTNFITGLITSVTGTSVNESSAISAFAVLLPGVSTGTVSSCTTTGGVAYEKGTNNALTCGSNLVWTPASSLLTINNASAGTALAITNPTAATGILNQNSPTFTLTGNYYSAGSLLDFFTFQNVTTSGSAVLTVTHSGASNPAVSLPGNLQVGNDINAAGISLGAGGVNTLTGGPITFAGGFGGDAQYAIGACEVGYGATTLSGSSTTTSLNCLPANSIILSVEYRITTTITTATSFTIGDSGSATRYCGTQSTLTAGTTGNCVAAGFYYNSGALGVLITPNMNPGAGAIRLMVTYLTLIPPTS